MEISGHWRSCPSEIGILWKRSPAKRISPFTYQIYPDRPRTHDDSITTAILTPIPEHRDSAAANNAAHDQGVHVRSALRSSIRRDKPLWIQGKWIEFERK